MNTRQLNSDEQDNLNRVKTAGLSYALLFITETGLKKSILDATQPLRTLLSSASIHNYSKQEQGPSSKVVLESIFLGVTESQILKVSLYRPNTKQGDPRIWFSGLGQFAEPDDVVCIFVCNGSIHLLNLSRLSQVKESTHNHAFEFLRAIESKSNAAAEELLQALKDLASAGPIDSVCKGSTAIGRSIETALGIPINSDRAPDFKGIEIKSGRSAIEGRQTRATLFACVPDWDISRCKSSAEILDNYGYERDGAFKLYCTVSAKAPNSQSLKLSVLEEEEMLHELADKPIRTNVAVWRLDKLHDRLSKKHKETFWIKARSEEYKGNERFHLQSVIHTKNPSLPQFDSFLGDGVITLDHLIKRKDKRVAEKGPLFKIERDRITDLFVSHPNNYNLS